MGVFYETVGRLVVAFVWRRFGRRIEVAGGLALVAGAIAAAAVAYLLASRDVEEG